MTCIPQRIKLNMKGNYIASYRVPSLVPIEFPLKTMPKRKLNRHVKITEICKWTQIYDRASEQKMNALSNGFEINFNTYEYVQYRYIYMLLFS